MGVSRTEAAAAVAGGCPQSVESAVLRAFENASRTPGALFCRRMRRVPHMRPFLRTESPRKRIAYHRSLFCALNIPSVPETVLRQISCCQVKQVWKILIQRSRSEARPYILLLIYFILLFRPSISPLLIEYFMAFLMGEMSRWTLFTKLTTSP